LGLNSAWADARGGWGRARAQKFSEEALEFQGRISHRNGLSDETYLPPSLHLEPPEVSMEHAREEARMVLFGAVTEVLERTGAAPLCRRASWTCSDAQLGGRRWVWARTAARVLERLSATAGVQACGRAVATARPTQADSLWNRCAREHECGARAASSRLSLPCPAAGGEVHGAHAVLYAARLTRPALTQGHRNGHCRKRAPGPPGAARPSAARPSADGVPPTLSLPRRRAGLAAKDIDILVVNCSLFNPTPSLSAMIANHFRMRSDLLSFNLAGMGCSAGVIAIGLAQRLLRTEPGKYALVVSTENITQARARRPRVWVWQGRGWGLPVAPRRDRAGGVRRGHHIGARAPS